MGNFTWRGRHDSLVGTVSSLLYVGGFWLVEAGAKLWGHDTWKHATSSFRNVPVLFQGLGEDSWLVGNTVRMPFDWLQEPTTGATAAETGGEWATPILSKMPFWFEWIMKIMLPTPEVAIFMQKFVIFVEMAIGLALIAGLFTWLASLASARFLVMFTLTAMLGWDKFWALTCFDCVIERIRTDTGVRLLGYSISSKFSWF